MNKKRQKSKAGEREKIRCRALNHLGQGVANLSDGLTVFVNGLLPGEEAEVELLEVKRNYARARLVSVLESSAQRVEPQCSVFGRCGGCSLQHLSYEGQLLQKAERVRESFIRIGAFPEALIYELLPEASMASASPLPWRYRCKSQMPIQFVSGDYRIGFYEQGSHDIVDSDACPIQDRAADLVRGALRMALADFPISAYDERSGEGLLRHLVVRVSQATKDVSVILVLNLSAEDYKNLASESELSLFLISFSKHLNDVLTSEGHALSALYLNHHTERNNLIMGPDLTEYYFLRDLEEEILGLKYRISPAAFFQVNPAQTQTLFSAVLELANLQGHERVFDLYCGAGSITLQLAQHAGKVKGCEIVPSAIQDAKHNAALNGIMNVDFEVGAAEALVPAWISAGERADLIVVDPPRKGLERSLIDTLLDAAPDKIIYVSCDPATLARDCHLLCESGLYELKHISAYDMFPQGMHVEACALLLFKA